MPVLQGWEPPVLGARGPWGGSIGANQHGRITNLLFAVMCYSKKGAQREETLVKCIFQPIVVTVSVEPPRFYICVITVSTGGHHNAYSAVPDSNGGIHPTRHRHLQLSCSFPMAGMRHFLWEMSKEDQRAALPMCSLLLSTTNPDLGD